jgi:hypothetical protein
MGFSDLFKSQRSGEGFELIPSAPEQNEAREYFMSLLSGNYFPTREIEGMSGSEQTGIELLNQFLAQPESGERAGAMSFLTGLLDQPVDVTQLPEIQALLSTVVDETADLVNTSLRRTQRSGMGDSGPQGSAAGREIAKGRTSMVAALAPYLSKVRSDKLSAASLINSLVSGAEGSALGKIGASQTYGALPRNIDQARSDADYEKLMNVIQSKYGAGQSLLGEKRYMYDPGTVGPSMFSQIAQGATGLIKALNPVPTPTP